MSKLIIDSISKFQGEVPTLQNQHQRITFLGCLPIQANTNFEKNKEGVETYWAQLLCNFSTSYNRTDEHGQTHDDNNVLKTLVVKFPMSYLKNNTITSSMFKNFFDANFVAKKFLILPVSEEKQSFQYVADKRVPIKNQTEVTISEDFDLKAFFASIDTPNKK